MTDAVRPPYAASWADRLTAAVIARTSQPFLAYLAVSTILVVVVIGTEWAVGAYPAGEIRPVHVVVAGIGPMWLWLIGIFNEAGARAAREVRPALALDEASAADLAWRLTAVPAGPTLLAGILTAAGSLTRVLVDPGSVRYIDFGDDPASMALAIAFVVVLTFTGAAYVAKQIWSAWQVHRLSGAALDVDLAQVHRLYGLSGLTGRMAVSMMASLTAFYGGSVETFRDPFGIWQGVLGVVVTVVVFVLPLAGIHERLVAAKIGALMAAQNRFTALSDRLHRAADEGDLAPMDALNKGIGAVEIELRTLRAIPTWPWQPDTFRWIVGALMFPIVLFVAQYLLGRLLELGAQVT